MTGGKFMFNLKDPSFGTDGVGRYAESLFKEEH